MNARPSFRWAYLAALAVLLVCSPKPAVTAEIPYGMQRLMGSPAPLFNLGIWRLDLLMKAVAEAFGGVSLLPLEQIQSLSGGARYDPQRNELVLSVRVVGWQKPLFTANGCKETWYRVREQVFWQEGIPFRPKVAEESTTTLLLRQFSQYAVEPHITSRDLQRELLSITRLALTAQGKTNRFVECSAPLVGGQFRVSDANR